MFAITNCKRGRFYIYKKNTIYICIYYILFLFYNYSYVLHDIRICVYVYVIVTVILKLKTAINNTVG